jgi:poly(3-hydroxybutyrate) depolymerase
VPRDARRCTTCGSRSATAAAIGISPKMRDVAFVDALVADLEAAYCVNQNAVFAAGFSYAGWMVNALACALPDSCTASHRSPGAAPRPTAREASRR